MCDFLAGLDMHRFVYWCMVLLLSVACFFHFMTMVCSLALPFSRCDGVEIFISILSFGLLDGFQNQGWRWSQVPFPKA